MIYPSTLPCPSLVGNVSIINRDTINTSFDFDDRFRITRFSPRTSNYDFILKDAAQVEEWIEFYNTSLNFGTDSIQANWLFGSSNTLKNFSFIEPPIITQISTNIYKIQASFFVS